MNRWMQIAYDEAVEGMMNNEGGPFGAVITKENRVIATAHNRVLSSNDPTAHAEINAIRIASKRLSNFDLSGCTLYTTCKPCPMCLGAILWARIDKVYYGATEEDAAKGGFDDSHFYDLLKGDTNTLKLQQIDHKQNVKLFEMWNKKEDRKLY